MRITFIYLLFVLCIGILFLGMHIHDTFMIHSGFLFAFSSAFLFSMTADEEEWAKKKA